jgi:hypothetical protein
LTETHHSASTTASLGTSKLVEKPSSLSALTEDWDDTIRFYLNGTKVAVDTINPEVVSSQSSVKADRLLGFSTATVEPVSRIPGAMVEMYLNGTKVAVDTINPEVTLLEYLRGIGLTGTKLGRLLNRDRRARL